MMVDFKKKVLSSGLSLVMVPMETESVTVSGVVRAGSRDEIEGQYGGAHFLEHMVFKGTEKYPKVGDISREIEGIGGIQNAFTWNDMTGFWVKIPKKYLEKGLDIVGELMNNPLLSEIEFEKERGTIIEEIKMYKDNYPVVAVDKMEDLLFFGTGLERAVIGTEKSIKNMSVENLKAFYDRWYFAENMVVVVSGGLEDEDKIAGLVEDKFSSIIKKGKFIDERNKEEFGKNKGQVVKTVEKDIQQVHLALGVRGLGPYSKKMYAWKVMNQVLGGGMTSRLWEEIREKRGLAYYIVSETESHKDLGMQVVRGGFKKGQELEVVKIVKDIVSDLSSNLVSEKEFLIAKESLKGKLVLGMESNNRVADWMAMDWALREGKIRKPSSMLEEVDKVTREEILEVAKDLWSGELFLGAVGPLKKGVEEEFKKVLKS